MSIEFNTKGIDYAKLMLAESPDRLRRAAVNAVNRTATHLRKNISKQIRNEYVVPAKEIKKSISVRRASRNRLTGQISAIGRPLTLNVFRVTEPKKGALKAKIRKSGGFKTVPGMFLGNSRKGYTGLMKRVEKKRAYPLRIPYGPSVPQMFGAKNVSDGIEKDAEKYLNKRFLIEVDYQMRR